MTLSPLLAWTLIGEFALTCLAIMLILLWNGRRRHRKRLDSVAALLTRMQAQETARMLRRTELLKSACRMPAAAAQTAAEATVNAEKECLRSLLLPLLQDDPDFGSDLDQVLYRLSDSQFDTLITAAGEPPSIGESVEDLLAFEPDEPEEDVRPVSAAPFCDDTSGTNAAPEKSQPSFAPAPPDDPGDAQADESLMQTLQSFGFAAEEATPTIDDADGGIVPADDAANGGADESQAPDRPVPADAEPAPRLSVAQTQEEIDAEVAAKLRELEAAVNELMGPDASPAVDDPGTEDPILREAAEPFETTSGSDAEYADAPVPDETPDMLVVEHYASASEEVPLAPEDAQIAAESGIDPQLPAEPDLEPAGAPPAKKRGARKSKPRGKKKQDPEAADDADSPNQPG